MNTLSRLGDIINANINAALDKAECPEKMIRFIIIEMEDALAELRTVAAMNLAEKKQLQRQISNLKQQLTHWQNKAEKAVSKNRDDLAKSALAVKLDTQAQLDRLIDQLTPIDECLGKIEQDNQALQAKLETAKTKQQSFKIRQASTVNRLKLREKATIYNLDKALNRFESYQQKLDRLEAELEAYDMTNAKSLNQEFENLEKENDIDAELNALKKQLKSA